MPDVEELSPGSLWKSPHERLYFQSIAIIIKVNNMCKIVYSFHCCYFERGSNWTCNTQLLVKNILSLEGQAVRCMTWGIVCGVCSVWLHAQMALCFITNVAFIKRIHVINYTLLY